MIHTCIKGEYSPRARSNHIQLNKVKGYEISHEAIYTRPGLPPLPCPALPFLNLLLELVQLLDPPHGSQQQDQENACRIERRIRMIIPKVQQMITMAQTMGRP